MTGRGQDGGLQDTDLQEAGPSRWRSVEKLT